MAESIVHIGENTPEHVAYKLMEQIAHLEGRSLSRRYQDEETADRKWLLDTYAECLQATTGRRNRAVSAA